MGLLKNPHLLRCTHHSSLRRTNKYASFLMISCALHLGVFEQPQEKDFFNTHPDPPLRKEGTAGFHIFPSFLKRGAGRFLFIVFIKTLASPQIAGSSIGEGSMKTVNTGTVVPLEKCPFRAFPSRPALYAGRLLTHIKNYSWSAV